MSNGGKNIAGAIANKKSVLYTFSENDYKMSFKKLFRSFMS